MPVYKVEEYVGKAIESILAQTFTEFEFLIVDDGTPDRSGEICDRYAKKDHRIRVIHKENGGAPSARNTAIDIAQGKYVYFLDSDDWAEPQMLADIGIQKYRNIQHNIRQPQRNSSRQKRFRKISYDNGKTSKPSGDQPHPVKNPLNGNGHKCSAQQNQEIIFQFFPDICPHDMLSCFP